VLGALISTIILVIIIINKKECKNRTKLSYYSKKSFEEMIDGIVNSIQTLFNQQTKSQKEIED